MPSPNHRDDHGPVRNQRAGPSRTEIVRNTDDGITCKINDGQHLFEVVRGWPGLALVSRGPRAVDEHELHAFKISECFTH